MHRFLTVGIILSSGALLPSLATGSTPLDATRTGTPGAALELGPLAPRVGPPTTRAEAQTIGADDVRTGSAAVEARASTDPWLRITIRLGEGGTGTPTFLFDDPDRAPDTLATLARAESEALGDDAADRSPVETIEGGTLAVRFGARPLDRIPELLTHLPDDRTGVSVLVRIPPGMTGGDIWEFQAQLSAARIRQVRFETDDPAPSHSTTQNLQEYP